MRKQVLLLVLVAFMAAVAFASLQNRSRKSSPAPEKKEIKKEEKKKDCSRHCPFS
ncbi:hypothetical protein [Flavihumibacter petaseus]|uniref:hypothetical protein n=1 Tax=Flavihumibacter petaseus TaxID=549295 RepID=UPI000A3F66FF|nr:hypothetical protein [Flavihumibacter petaseus]